MEPEKCLVCWASSVPPYEWHRANAPNIPGTKKELLEMLSLYDRTPLPEDQLKNLTKTELKTLFRKNIRGEKHSCDPCQNLSSKSKMELQEINAKHGLEQHGTKGELMLRLRDHWSRQCGLATCLDANDSECASSWCEIHSSHLDPGIECTKSTNSSHVQ